MLNVLTITQTRRRRWTPAPAYGRKPPTLPRRADRSRPRHADGRAAAPLLASGRPRRATPARRRGRCAMLGEDLILFRDGQGRPGLVYPRCCHRGTTLYYGKVEERGIRCCYHGWLFDVEGHCLEQPCEPEPAGRSASACASRGIRSRSATAWSSPISGPPEKKPVLPRYECLEVLGAGRVRRGRRFAASAAAASQIVPCNWLQHFENVVDPLPRADPARQLQRPAVRRADGGYAGGAVRTRPDSA